MKRILNRAGFALALAAGLALAGCNTGAAPGQTSSPTGTTGNTGASLIVAGLTPICANTLRDKDVIPQAARNAGVDEAAVCECGLRRAETKLISNPALLVDILRSTDAQVQLLVQVGTECTAELVQRALTGQPIPTPTPGTGSNWPFPYPTPSSTPNPSPTFWPPAG